MEQRFVGALEVPNCGQTSFNGIGSASIPESRAFPFPYNVLLSGASAVVLDLPTDPAI